ncbi:MAG: hypothetical protein FVQ79_08975 [Planctomycetes bacterium]|nr:hypothetical protein [Planctomycetota bacterium]
MKKIVILTLLLSVLPGSAAIISVEPDGSGDQPTIQAAIDAAVSNDEIVLSVGTYTGDGNRDIDFGGKSITIRSTDPEDPHVVASTVIDCEGTQAEHHRAFYFHSGEDEKSAVKGLTIINGYARIVPYHSSQEALGGAILCESSSPSIVNCSFTNNRATCKNGKSRRSNCGKGGAIFLHDKSNASIINCEFTGNNAFWGGAIYSGSRVAPKVSKCKFANNTAGLGGAIFAHYSQLIVSNCSFVNNSSSSRYGGGAVYSQSGKTDLYNCTFSGNSAQSNGGVVSYAGDRNATVKNCIFWGNSGKAIALRYSSTINVDYCNVQGGKSNIHVTDKENTLNWGVGNSDVDPRFAAPDSNVLQLLSGSPCIDVGDPDYVTDTDKTGLGGNPRVVNGRIDMGAYEFQKLYQAKLAKAQLSGLALIDARIAKKFSKKYEGVWAYKLKGQKDRPAKTIILRGKRNKQGKLNFSFLHQDIYNEPVFVKSSADQYRVNIYFKLKDNRSVMYSLARKKEALTGTIYSSWKNQSKVTLRKLTTDQAIKAIESSSAKIKQLTGLLTKAQAKAESEKKQKDQLQQRLEKLEAAFNKTNTQNAALNKKHAALEQEYKRIVKENRLEAEEMRKKYKKINDLLTKAKKVRPKTAKTNQREILDLSKKQTPFDENAIGEWVNIDEDTGGTTKIAISQKEGKWIIRGWGSCHPSDCDWGEVPLLLIANKSHDDSYTRGFAVWDFGFKSTQMILQIRDGHLFADKLNIYKEGDRRSSYFKSDEFELKGNEED